MERVNYQHYVPRFYLDGFKGKDGKLWCYDKKLDRAYTSSAENLGGENLFYDTPEVEKEHGVPQFLEKWFHPLESMAAFHLKNWRTRLASRRQFAPTEVEAHDMALFMVVQFLRTPRARRLAVDLHLLAAKLSFFNYLGETHPELAERIQDPLKEMDMTLEKERWPYVHAKLLTNVELIEELASVFVKHVWLVTENLTGRAYYTSDNPVIKIRHAKHSVKAMTGLASPGIQIVYPLSPEYGLNLLERTFWKQFEKFDRQVLTSPTTAANLDFDNSIQVQHSARFVYCRENDFSTVREMCDKTPELRNPNLPEFDSRMGNEM